MEPPPASRKARIAVAQPAMTGSRLLPIRSLTSRAGVSCSHASRKIAALLTQPRKGATALAARSVTASSRASPMIGVIAGWPFAQLRASGSNLITAT